jgi:hypothetical protein
VINTSIQIHMSYWGRFSEFPVIITYFMSRWCCNLSSNEVFWWWNITSSPHLVILNYRIRYGHIYNVMSSCCDKLSSRRHIKYVNISTSQWQKNFHSIITFIHKHSPRNRPSMSLLPTLYPRLYNNLYDRTRSPHMFIIIESHHHDHVIGLLLLVVT